IALNAIANWEDDEAMDVLFNIAEKETNRENSQKALEGYINLIESSTINEVRKVLLLRKALNRATSKSNIQLALSQLANYPTLQALMVSGNYLDNPEVQQEAARAVMN